MMSERKVAVFYLDRTLIRVDSFHKYIWYAIKENPFSVVRGWYLPIEYIMHLLRLRDNEWLKTTFLSVLLKQRKMWDVQESGKRFVIKLLPHVRQAALDRLEYHRNQGHYTVLATASPDFYVEPIKAFLRFDEIVCTKIAWSTDGMFKGLNGGNCYGSQKLRRIEETLSRLGAAELTAVYTDHKSDRPILTATKMGYLVNPDKQTKASCSWDGLQVVDWD